MLNTTNKIVAADAAADNNSNIILRQTTFLI